MQSQYLLIKDSGIALDFSNLKPQRIKLGVDAVELFIRFNKSGINGVSLLVAPVTRHSCDRVCKALLALIASIAGREDQHQNFPSRQLVEKN
ncbi:MAG: hypothetical protein HY231_13100 [Acidobacteria bacterium]|nr:hypothetical protein [Acidobacteriota bacterium]